MADVREDIQTLKADNAKLSQEYLSLLENGAKARGSFFDRAKESRELDERLARRGFAAASLESDAGKREQAHAAAIRNELKEWLATERKRQESFAKHSQELRRLENENARLKKEYLELRQGSAALSGSEFNRIREEHELEDRLSKRGVAAASRQSGAFNKDLAAAEAINRELKEHIPAERKRQEAQKQQKETLLAMEMENEKLKEAYLQQKQQDAYRTGSEFDLRKEVKDLNDRLIKRGTAAASRESAPYKKEYAYIRAINTELKDMTGNRPKPLASYGRTASGPFLHPGRKPAENRT